MGLGPPGDLARAGNSLALVQEQNRHVALPGQFPDLLPAAAPVAPGPGHEAIAGQVADLVLVAGVIERLGGTRTRMTPCGPRLLLPAGVEDHPASLSSRAITSGTCARYAS